MKMLSAIATMSVLATLAGGQEAAAPGQATVITADSLSFDYGRSIAIFEANVVVKDPQIQLTSDALKVFLDGTNQVKSITASGNVRIWQADKTAVCRTAIYMARTGEVILQGDAQVTRGPDAVSGDEITFFVNDDRMTCRGRSTLTIYPSKDAPQSPAFPALLGPKRTGSP